MPDPWYGGHEDLVETLHLIERVFEGAEGDSAASILTKAAQGCGVSPKALLVILQKEQGLVTASGPALVPSRYRSAMGYACPDTATCNDDFSGFAGQVWFAARQFRVYEGDPGHVSCRAGETRPVLFNPDPDCGSRVVTMENQATAGLYNYTPYQPDDAALSGSGSSCSSGGTSTSSPTGRPGSGTPTEGWTTDRARELGGPPHTVSPLRSSRTAPGAPEDSCG